MVRCDGKTMVKRWEDDGKDGAFAIKGTYHPDYEGVDTHDG